MQTYDELKNFSTPVVPAPPARYNALFFESIGLSFWAWDKASSGEGNEQQDLFGMDAPCAGLVPELREGQWVWVLDETHCRSVMSFPQRDTCIKRIKMLNAD